METAGLIIRMLGALAIILGLLISAQYALRIWTKRLHGNKKDLIEVMATRMILPKKYLCIVRVEEKTLIIGASENAMSLLGTLETDRFKTVFEDKLADEASKQYKNI